MKELHHSLRPLTLRPTTDIMIRKTLRIKTGIESRIDYRQRPRNFNDFQQNSNNNPQNNFRNQNNFTTYDRNNPTYNRNYNPNYNQNFNRTRNFDNFNFNQQPNYPQNNRSRNYRAQIFPSSQNFREPYRNPSVSMNTLYPLRRNYRNHNSEGNENSFPSQNYRSFNVEQTQDINSQTMNNQNNQWEPNGPPPPPIETPFCRYCRRPGHQIKQCKRREENNARQAKNANGTSR